jgi:hypothetical protein
MRLTADHSLGLGNDQWSEPSSRRGLLGIFETAGRRNSPRELHNKSLISAAQVRLDRNANGAVEIPESR